MDRLADAARRPGEQGFREAKSGAGGTHRARPRAAPLHDGGLPAPAGARRAGDRAQRAIPALPCVCGRCASVDIDGWMRRLRQPWKERSRCSTAWAPPEPWCSSWRVIRCIPGYRAFSSRPWSAVWARTAVSQRHCLVQAPAWRKMTCWQPSMQIRITAPGSKWSSCAGLRGLPGRRSTTTMPC